MDHWPRVSWVEAEPRRADRERQAMAPVARELRWVDTAGWEGLVPAWPFDRPAPPALDTLLAGRRLRLHVEYLEGFPVAAPVLWPLDPQPDPRYRTQHAWHVNPNGSLCLMQSAGDWDGTETAADLVEKAAGWFLEYLLMEAGVVETMTVDGIATDTSRDHLFQELVDAP